MWLIQASYYFLQGNGSTIGSKFRGYLNYLLEWQRWIFMYKVKVDDLDAKLGSYFI